MAGSWKYVKAPKRTSVTQTDRGWWSEKKKLEAVTTYIGLGSPSLTAQQIGVPIDTLKTWMKSEWWKEKIKEIQSEDYDKLDTKISKALNKAIDSINDRIENGEFVYDPKTGKVRQIPTRLRDLNNAFNTLLDKRQLIRKQPTKIVEQTTTADLLQDLAKKFAAFTDGKQIKDVEKPEYIEGETVIQESDGTWVVKTEEDDDALHDQWKT